MNPQSTKTLPHGTRFGSYEILGTIGAGGMGVVYRAYDVRLGRSVAIKTLPAGYSSDPSRLNHFEREARALSSLNHPNIVTLYALGEPESIYYIVMEFVEGQTLRHHIATEKMRLSTVLSVGTQMASALSAAHTAGILHRDIKPENVILRPDGLVKILDFGLAKLTQPDSPSLSGPKCLSTTETGLRIASAASDVSIAANCDIYTLDTLALGVSSHSNPYLTTPNEVSSDAASQMVLGTAAYMSPERLRGQEVDVRADIFSLGVTLYELVAGVTPFGGRSAGDVINAVFEEEPTPLSHYRPEVPRELERIIRKALRKDRDCRYQNIKDMLIDLQDVKQEQAFEATFKRSARYELFDQAKMRMARQCDGELISVEPIQLSQPISSNGNSAPEVILSEIVNEKLASVTRLAAPEEISFVILIGWRHSFRVPGIDGPG
jgi:serine/threonine protein kinase